MLRIQMANEACYILFKNFGKARVYYEKDLDIGMLKKGMYSSKYMRFELFPLFYFQVKNFCQA